MVNVPLYAPVAVGLKATEMVHFAPAEREVRHVLVSTKFALATMLVIDSATLPVLVNVTFLVALVDPNTPSGAPRKTQAPAPQRASR